MVIKEGRNERLFNAIYLTDRQGVSVAMSAPVSGNHNDLFDIEAQFQEVVSTLEKTEISVDGLFINADAGFDSQKLRNKCEAKGIVANICPNKRNGNTDTNYYFDEKLYQERYAIERKNACIDSFRSLLNRFDTTITSWKGFNSLAFIVIGLKKFYKIKKSR